MDDPYLNMELGINREEHGYQHTRINQRAVDEAGKPIGIAHDNPLTASRLYKTEYVDGQIENMTANLIAENLLASR